MALSLDSITKDQVRSLVLALLRKHNAETAANTTESYRPSPYRSLKWSQFYQLLLEEAGLSEEHYAMRGQFLLFAEEILWEFIGRGLLVPRAIDNCLDMHEPKIGWSCEAIVDLSRDYLVTPYDVSSYVRYLASLLPNLDSTVSQAMEESVRAFNARCYASAVVMYGVAAEAKLLDVFEAFANALDQPLQKQEMQKLTEKPVLTKLKALRDKIELVSKVHHALKENPLKDAWEFGIADLSNVVRQQRNNAGHPELRSNFQPGVALGFLCSAPHHLWLLTRLEEYFQRNPVHW